MQGWLRPLDHLQLTGHTPMHAITIVAMVIAMIMATDITGLEPIRSPRRDLSRTIQTLVLLVGTESRPTQCYL